MDAVKYDVAIMSQSELTISNEPYTVEVNPAGLSLTGPRGTYGVTWQGHCSCPDHHYRGSFCKHLQAAAKYAKEILLLICTG